MERFWAGQLPRPVDRCQVILDRNKLVLMNEWMNGHRGRIASLNIMTITALRRLYLPSIFLSSSTQPSSPSLSLSPLHSLFPFFLSLPAGKRSKSAIRPFTSCRPRRSLGEYWWLDFRPTWRLWVREIAQSQMVTNDLRLMPINIYDLHALPTGRQQPACHNRIRARRVRKYLNTAV